MSFMWLSFKKEQKMFARCCVGRAGRSQGCSCRRGSGAEPDLREESTPGVTSDSAPVQSRSPTRGELRDDFWTGITQAHNSTKLTTYIRSGCAEFFDVIASK